MIYLQKKIYREDLRNNPNALFVFGDNWEQWGLGGQAAECRGEPNAVGIPTKVSPYTFFRDDWLLDWELKARDIFKRLRSYETVVVWPADDIGSGRADLLNKAPRIWASLQRQKQELFKYHDFKGN